MVANLTNNFSRAIVGVLTNNLNTWDIDAVGGDTNCGKDMRLMRASGF